MGELLLGHVRYGTFGKNSLESVHPFLRQNNWKHRNLIVAGNFNMTNVNELFENLVDLGQHPKERADTITVMEKIGHFLDDAVAKIYKKLKEEGFTKAEASPHIAARLKMHKVLQEKQLKIGMGVMPWQVFWVTVMHLYCVILQEYALPILWKMKKLLLWPPNAQLSKLFLM